VASLNYKEAIMARTPEASLAVLTEATPLVRQSHSALKALNHLLCNTEQGTQIDTAELACLLIPIQERMYGALDELESGCRRAAVEM
jgi:hypothetical protein